MSSQDGRVAPNNEGPVRHVESLVGICPVTAFIVQVTYSLVLLHTNWTDNSPLHTLVIETSGGANASDYSSFRRRLDSQCDFGRDRNVVCASAHRFWKINDRGLIRHDEPMGRLHERYMGSVFLRIFPHSRTRFSLCRPAHKELSPCSSGSSSLTNFCRDLGISIKRRMDKPPAFVQWDSLGRAFTAIG